MGNYDSWKTTEPDPEPPGNREGRERRRPAGRCQLCTDEAYGSFPGKVLCRAHFADEQRRAIAALVDDHLETHDIAFGKDKP